MRGSAASTRGQSQHHRSKDFLTLNRTPSIRRQLGDVMNLKPQPVYSPQPYRYMGSPRSPHYPPRTNAHFFGSRVSPQPQPPQPPQQPPPPQPPQQVSAYNRPSLQRKQSEPVTWREPNINAQEIRRSQAVAVTARDQTSRIETKKGQDTVQSKQENASSVATSRMTERSETNRNKSVITKTQPKFQEDMESSFGFKYSFRSKKGYNPTFNKQNQDACIVIANMNNRQWQHFFAVCDGHGQVGHLVSSTLRSHFLTIMANSPDFHKKPNQNLYLSFRSAIQRCMRDNIDLSTSGSTMVSCYLLQNKLYCANVGDSRAIMGVKDKNGKWSAKALSNDHKPSLPLEAQRIYRFNGRIDSLRDHYGNPVGPLRVWYRDQNVPGLAMTRSIGDLVAAQVGVTWQPQTIQYNITPNDRILIIASDGVWEFLNNQQIISKMAPYYQANQLQEASKLLMEMATASWAKNTTIIDDISFILVFLSHQ